MPLSQITALANSSGRVLCLQTRVWSGLLFDGGDNGDDVEPRNTIFVNEIEYSATIKLDCEDTERFPLAMTCPVIERTYAGNFDAGLVLVAIPGRSPPSYRRMGVLVLNYQNLQQYPTGGEVSHPMRRICIE